MCEIYTPARERGISTKAVLFGGILAVATFALLPLLQGIGDLIRPPAGPEVLTKDSPELPQVLEEPDPIVKPEPKVDKPKIEEEPPPIDLRTLEILLNPSDNGVQVSTNLGTVGKTNCIEELVHLMRDLDTKPSVIAEVKPTFPYEMRGTKGKVIVEFVIDSSGNVKRPRIHSSSHWQFEQPALDAVKRSKWKPGKIDGQSVSTMVRLPVEFKN